MNNDIKLCKKCAFDYGSCPECDACHNNSNYEHKDRQTYLDLILDTHKKLAECGLLFNTNEKAVFYEWFHYALNLYNNPDDLYSLKYLIVSSQKVTQIINDLSNDAIKQGERINTAINNHMNAIKDMVFNLCQEKLKEKE